MPSMQTGDFECRAPNAGFLNDLNRFLSVYDFVKIDIAAKRRKKHRNIVSGLVNSMCYNEQKL